MPHSSYDEDHPPLICPRERLVASEEVSCTDEEMCSVYREILESRFPNLTRALPPGYPTKFVTVEEMKSYSDTRMRRFWHTLNLPFAVHMLTIPDQPTARAVGTSLLKTLDDFCGQFHALPGFRATLAPLWGAGIWQLSDPQFWSIVSCAFLALTYKGNGNQVIAFGRKIGDGEPDADITFRLNDTLCHVDVEMWHSTALDGLSEQEVAERLRQRADTKLGKKYAALPPNEIGVVAIVCVPDRLDTAVLRSNATPTLIDGGDLQRHNQYAKIYWLGQVSSDDGHWWFEITSRRSSPATPPSEET